VTPAKELDARPDELGATGHVAQHRRHSRDAEVPAADRQQSLDARLSRLQVVEPRVPARCSQESTPYPLYRQSRGQNLTKGRIACHSVIED